MALVGIKEVADMLGVSRTRADQLSRRPNFPEPKVRHARVRLWEDKDVQALDEGEPPVVRLTPLKDLQAAPPAQATAGPGLGDLALRARGCQPRTPAGSTPGDRRVQRPAQLPRLEARFRPAPSCCACRVD